MEIKEAMIELPSKERLSGIYTEIQNGKPVNPAEASRFLYAGPQSKRVRHPQPARDTVTMESSGLRRAQPFMNTPISTARSLAIFLNKVGSVSAGS